MTDIADDSFILNWRYLENEAALTEMETFGETVQIGDVTTLAVYKYPTKEEVLLREGGKVSNETMMAKMRIPELSIHKASGHFPVGTPVKVLCRLGSPEFVVGELYFTEGSLYRMVLHHVQPAPVDTKGRGWQ